MTDYDHRTIETNGIKLHVVQAGPEDGPLAILLHGFPEFWRGMKTQMDYLAEQGFRVWVPDQRGYNLSDKPQRVAAYGIEHLAADVIGLIDAAGRDKVYLAGHDWGAAVAWWTAIKYPDRLEKLVILNVPHPMVMQQHLRSSFAQMRKSWYMFFFQLPLLPELLASRNNFETNVQALRATSRPGTFSEDDLELYREAWAQPGAMTGMINYYRAIFRSSGTAPPDMRLRVPTLMIWGAKDPFLGSEMARPSIDLCDSGQLVMIDEATHWVQHEEADRVNQLIHEFWGDQ